MKTLYLIQVLSFLALGLAALAIFVRVRKEAVTGSMRGSTTGRNRSRAMQFAAAGQQANAGDLDTAGRERRQAKGKR